MSTQDVLNKAPGRSAIQKKLNSYIQQKRKELKQQTAAYQDSVAAFKQRQSSMTQQEASQSKKQLQQMRASMKQFQRSIQKQIQQRRSELLQPLYDKMNKAIEAVAQERNIDFVLNKGTSGGQKVIYYSANQKLDITQQVLQRMKKQSTQN